MTDRTPCTDPNNCWWGGVCFSPLVNVAIGLGIAVLIFIVVFGIAAIIGWWGER